MPEPHLKRGAVRLDRNKIRNPRPWALAPGVREALLARRKVMPGETEESSPVFTEPEGNPIHVDRFAERFGDMLRRTKGIDRPELFERSASRHQIRAHDLRASFVTVALANGHSEDWSRGRSGHTSSQQVANYRRAARTVAEFDVGDWSPLASVIPESGKGWAVGEGARKTVPRKRQETK